jgi:hypothetical protein
MRNQTSSSCSAENPKIQQKRERRFVRTLQGTEDAGTGGGAGQTDVQQGAERGHTFTVILDVELLAVNQHVALVADGVLGVDAASQQQTGGIGSGVVGQTDGQAITLQLVRVSRGQADVVLDVGREHLADDITVGLFKTKKD